MDSVFLNIGKILEVKSLQNIMLVYVWEPYGSFSPQLYELWCEAGEKCSITGTLSMHICKLCVCVSVRGKCARAPSKYVCMHFGHQNVSLCKRLAATL